MFRPSLGEGRGTGRYARSVWEKLLLAAGVDYIVIDVAVVVIAPCGAAHCVRRHDQSLCGIVDGLLRRGGVAFRLLAVAYACGSLPLCRRRGWSRCLLGYVPIACCTALSGSGLYGRVWS